MKLLFMILLMVFSLMISCRALNPAASNQVEQPVRIAFVSDRDGNAEIYLMERDGSNLINLTNNSSGNDTLPTWSPQAEALAYVTKKDKGGMMISRMKIDGTGQTILSEKPPLIPIPLVWDPTGNWLAFGSEAAADVYVLNSTGEILKNLSNDPGRDDFQGWSPDGSRILFTSKREGAQAIYVVNIEDGEPVRLTELASNSGRPAWSPDGGKIAFISDRDNGDVEIYVAEANGENPVRLTHSKGFDGYPTWSPDGSRIAFASLRDGDNEIYVMNADGTGQTNLTNSPDSTESIRGDFAWSPDGRQILFHSDRTGKADVFVMNADGSNQVNLTHNPATDFSAIWVTLPQQ